MTVLFSRACEYALRGLIVMARQPDRKTWSTLELASLCQSPAPFLNKTFQQLVRAGVLRSKRGRQGGFSFAREPGEITVIEIIHIIDGKTLSASCVMGFDSCGDENPCPFHRHWNGIRSQLVEALKYETLARMANSKDRLQF